MAGPQSWKGDRSSDDPNDQILWQLNQIRGALLFIILAPLVIAFLSVIAAEMG
jgi:hypothetical protein